MKICIIKLGAKGDVVRTLPLLIGIKRKSPQSKITWITKKESEEIIKTSPYVNEILNIPIDKTDKFDILYNLDIEDEATELAQKIHAGEKYGFCSNNGFVSSYNLGGEYYLNTLFDDETKKNNKKTYQEMIFEIAELPYNKEYHEIFLPPEAHVYAEAFIKEKGIHTNRLIGIHIGAASRWPSKVWHEDNVKEFIKKMNEKDYEILLFGGPNEIEQLKKFSDSLKTHTVFINDPRNSDLEFAALMHQCRVIVCGDSFALHIALVLKKPTIGLFFCTPPNEIEGYSLLKKLVSLQLYDFFPERMDEYNEDLTKSISADSVILAVENFL